MMLSKEQDELVCRSIDCQRVIQQKNILQPSQFKAYLDFNKKIIRQNRTKVAQQKKYRAETIIRYSEENQHIRQSILKTNPSLSEDAMDLLDIPVGNQSLQEVEKERQIKYRAHLAKIISEADQYDSVAEVVYNEHRDAHEKIRLVENKFSGQPQLRTLCDTLCYVCRGGCCAKGGEHAYLSVFTMRQYMDDHPEISADELLNTYLGYTANEAVIGGCINQSEKGCVLPRELRSDICNGYYCDNVKAWLNEQTTDAYSGTLLVIQRACDNWSRFEPEVDDAVQKVFLMDASASLMELPIPK